MPRFILLIPILILTLSTSTTAQAPPDETKNVLSVLHTFFDSIEKHDSIMFNAVFFPDAHMFISRPLNDSTLYISKPAVGRSFFKPGTTYRETMRDKGVKMEVHQNIAMAWVPYDFYVNEKFSHCGIDVFTLMKTKQGWKISLIAYSVEKIGCENW